MSHTNAIPRSGASQGFTPAAKAPPSPRNTASPILFGRRDVSLDDDEPASEMIRWQASHADIPMDRKLLNADSASEMIPILREEVERGELTQKAFDAFKEKEEATHALEIFLKDVDFFRASIATSSASISRQNFQTLEAHYKTLAANKNVDLRLLKSSMTKARSAYQPIHDHYQQEEDARRQAEDARRRDQVRRGRYRMGRRLADRGIYWGIRMMGGALGTAITAQIFPPLMLVFAYIPLGLLGLTFMMGGALCLVGCVSKAATKLCCYHAEEARRIDEEEMLNPRRRCGCI